MSTSGPRRLTLEDALRCSTARRAAMNSQPTSCAAFPPEFETATQTRSRVNLDQAAGPLTGDNLAPDSPTNGQARRRRPAGDISELANRPVVEA